MAKLPPPDVAKLASLVAMPYVLPAGFEIWRIYKRGGKYPAGWSDFRYYGPIAGSRFDHHQRNADGEPCDQSRGIMYGAKDIITCVAECFQLYEEVDRSRDEPWLVSFQLTSDVILLDLRGLWPTRAGASTLINSDIRRDLTQAWSAAIYDTYPDIQGLWYGSSMAANNPAITLYERARAAVPSAPTFHRELTSTALTRLLANCCDELKYDLR